MNTVIIVAAAPVSLSSCPHIHSMSPIRISPEREVYISTDQTTLGQKEPTAETKVVREEVYVVPSGESEHYIVRVEGFSKEPGGIVETERLTSGNRKDNIILTTPEDPRLSAELGVTAVKIDGVVYEATNVEDDKK